MLALTLLAALSPSYPAPAPEVPGVVLNEIMFDAAGPAGAEGSWQWVELAVLKETQLDGSWTLNNAQGSVLSGLPELTLPAGSFLMVLLGPHDPELENLDPAEGPLVITSGQGWGDHLGVSAGGVQLKHQGQTQDELYWGGYPGTPHFALGYGAGNLLEEEESLGRNAVSFYTGQASDWAIAGGANSNGVTMGAPNIVELLGESDLVLHQDSVLNSVLLGLSMSFTGPGWIRVTETNPTVKSYRLTLPGGDSASIVVEHSFEVLVDGVLHTFTGEVGTVFRRTTDALAASESTETSGTITSADGSYSLAVDLKETYSGAHAMVRSLAYSSDYTWSQGGNAYPVTLAGTMITTWDSDTQQSTVDTRQAQDFGGAGIKTASAQWTRTRLDDGVFTVESTVTRSFPSVLPRPGEDQSWASGQQEVLYQDLAFTRDAFGQTSSAFVTRYEQYLDGFLWAQLQDQAVGTMAWDQTPVSGRVTAFSFEMTLPLEGADGEPFDHVLNVDGTHTDTGEKEVTKLVARNTSGTTQRWELEVAVDPPNTPFGDDPCPLCKGKKKKKNLKQKLKTAGITTATCVGAGVLGQMTANSKAGKKAIRMMIGKAAAKRAIPVVGWVVTAGCGVGAILDWFD
jgi:hypothetical protein